MRALATYRGFPQRVYIQQSTPMKKAVQMGSDPDTKKSFEYANGATRIKMLHQRE